nr:hypothetical protein [uncultured Porphyromonas sp.]
MHSKYGLIHVQPTKASRIRKISSNYLSCFKCLNKAKKRRGGIISQKTMDISKTPLLAYLRSGFKGKIFPITQLAVVESSIPPMLHVDVQK